MNWKRRNLHSCWWHLRFLWRRYRVKPQWLACDCPWPLGYSCRRCSVEPVDALPPSLSASIVFVASLSHPLAKFLNFSLVWWFFRTSTFSLLQLIQFFANPHTRQHQLFDVFNFSFKKKNSKEQKGRINYKAVPYRLISNQSVLQCQKHSNEFIYLSNF